MPQELQAPSYWILVEYFCNVRIFEGLATLTASNVIFSYKQDVLGHAPGTTSLYVVVMGLPTEMLVIWKVL